MLPATYIWIRGRFVDQRNNPLTGTITFIPNAPGAVDPTAKLIIQQSGTSIGLDSTGAFAVQLLATDDPDITPTAWTYKVVEPRNGRTYTISTPVSTPVLDSPSDPLDGEQVIELSDIVPMPGSSGGVGQLLRGVGIASMVNDGSGNILVTYTDGSTDTIDGPFGGGGSDTSGSLSSPEAVGDGLVVTITSNWGINVDGDPYYDPAGADPDEAAIATLDPFGHLVLTNAQGG